jgi:hypothetical protein
VPNRRLLALMRTVLFLAAAPALLAASRCPDLSGAYLLQGEDGQVRISIKQHNCDRIVIVRENNYLGTITSETHTLALDGKEHPDTPWLGARKPGQTSARFQGSELWIETKTAGDATLAMIYSLTADRDLQAKAGEGGRQGSPSIATRLR